MAGHAASGDALDAGLVLGQTVTVAGQDFYQSFVMFWREKALSERYSLVVRERPSARAGSLIWIESRGRRVLQLVLPASRAHARRFSEQAADDLWQRLTEAEIEASIEAGMEGGRDLARDEL